MYVPPLSQSPTRNSRWTKRRSPLPSPQKNALPQRTEPRKRHTVTVEESWVDESGKVAGSEAEQLRRRCAMVSAVSGEDPVCHTHVAIPAACGFPHQITHLTAESAICLAIQSAPDIGQAPGSQSRFREVRPSKHSTRELQNVAQRERAWIAQAQRDYLGV